MAREHLDERDRRVRAAIEDEEHDPDVAGFEAPNVVGPEAVSLLGPRLHFLFAVVNLLCIREDLRGATIRREVNRRQAQKHQKNSHRFTVHFPIRHAAA